MPVTGRLLCLACPFLEDELVHNLLQDPDFASVQVVQNPNARTIIPKLEREGIPYNLILEKDLQSDGSSDRCRYEIIILMMDAALHSEPTNLLDEVRSKLLQLSGQFDGVALYYGLCGNGLNGIREWAAENLSVPLTIFSDAEGNLCDDCICVPLGSSSRYQDLMREHTGEMYLTPAMACNWFEYNSDPSKIRGLEATGMSPEEFMKMLFEMAGYERCLMIQTGLGDQERFQEKCQEFAERMGLELLELEDGWVHNEVAERLHSEARSFLKSSR